MGALLRVHRLCGKYTPIFLKSIHYNIKIIAPYCLGNREESLV
jgi:hypothetical protein